MAYKPQHLRRGVAKTTPGYVGRHRKDDEPTPEPCQPIGCDNGYHLRGCPFAPIDREEVIPQ